MKLFDIAGQEAVIDAERITVIKGGITIYGKTTKPITENGTEIHVFGYGKVYDIRPIEDIIEILREL